MLSACKCVFLSLLPPLFHVIILHTVTGYCWVQAVAESHIHTSYPDTLPEKASLCIMHLERVSICVCVCERKSGCSPFEHNQAEAKAKKKNANRSKKNDGNEK